MSDSATLSVRVIPNAKKDEFAGYRVGELLLRLSAPAVEGKANKAAIEFLARYFGVARSDVVLIRGEKSRHKVFQILGLESSDISTKLSSL
jgi:uncharacterized protein (TIGR00251 family)